jgi:hypothetical protein
MGGQDDGDALFGLEPTQHLEHSAATTGSSAEVISSQSSNRGIHHQGPRDRHALPLAAGELVDRLRMFAGNATTTERCQCERGMESGNRPRNAFPMGYRAINPRWIEPGIAGPGPTCGEVMSSAQR